MNPPNLQILSSGGENGPYSTLPIKVPGKGTLMLPCKDSESELTYLYHMFVNSAHQELNTLQGAEGLAAGLLI